MIEKENVIYMGPKNVLQIKKNYENYMVLGLVFQGTIQPPPAESDYGLQGAK